ncbi:MAG: transporter [Bacteroidetes bacterium]|nr:transporter [Bacteroidota bacterium]
MRYGFLLVLLCIALSAFVHAQHTHPLVTDRPDQTESASIVPAGWLQIEAGLLWESIATAAHGIGASFHADAAVGDYTEIPGILLRFGISDAMEFRAATALAMERVTRDPAIFDPTNRGYPAMELDTLGVQPVTFGVKAHLLHEKGWIPQTAILASVTIPASGSRYFSPRWMTQEIRLAFAHTLSDRFSLGYNLGIASPGETSAHTGLYSLAFGAGVTETFSLFAEIFGDLAGDAAPVHAFDAGMTVLLSPDLQLDASAGLTLHEDAFGIHRRMEHFLGTGVSWRVQLTD